MLFLILLLVIGSTLVYISRFNFLPVSVNLGFYVFNNVPLFYVIVASLLFGLILSYIAYIIHNISTSLTIHNKNKEIEKDKDEILELTKRVHQLELEKEKIKNGSESKPSDKKAL